MTDLYDSTEERRQLLRTARLRLGHAWGRPRGPLSLSELGEVLGLQGRDPGNSVRDMESGKDRISYSIVLALLAMMDGWRPPGLDEYRREWGWEGRRHG
jgi:hypothetical protein